MRKLWKCKASGTMPPPNTARCCNRIPSCPVCITASAGSSSRRPPPATPSAKSGQEFQAELAIDPSNAGAEYVLGELARQDRNYAEAIEHFGKATKLNRTFADPSTALG